jgi:hypothetical protein
VVDIDENEQAIEEEAAYHNEQAVDAHQLQPEALDRGRETWIVEDIRFHFCLERICF